MKELILIVVGAALVNNIILSQFQGLCPFLAYPKRRIRRQVWALRSYSLLPWQA